MDEALTACKTYDAVWAFSTYDAVKAKDALKAYEALTACKIYDAVVAVPNKEPVIPCNTFNEPVTVKLLVILVEPLIVTFPELEMDKNVFEPEVTVNEPVPVDTEADTLPTAIWDKFKPTILDADILVKPDPFPWNDPLNDPLNEPDVGIGPIGPTGPCGPIAATVTTLVIGWDTLTVVPALLSVIDILLLLSCRVISLLFWFMLIELAI